MPELRAEDAVHAWIVQIGELLSRCLCLGQHLELGGSKSSLNQHNHRGMLGG